MKITQRRTRKNSAAPGRRISQTLAAAALVIATFLIAQAQSDQVVKTGIDNFGKVNANYYRGEQPDEDGFAELKRLGVKTIIDLREDNKPEAQGWAGGLGMQYFNIPLSSRRPATDEQTAYFLKLVNDPNNWPVYVHCAAGRHRTGEMTAIYRITNDGWTADQAYQEMKQYGWYSWGGRGTLKDYVYSYYNQYLASRGNGDANAGAAGAAATIAQAQPHGQDGGNLRIESVQFKDGKKLIILGEGLAPNAIVKINGTPVDGATSFDGSKRRLKLHSRSADLERLQAAGNQLEVVVGGQSAAFTFR